MISAITSPTVPSEFKSNPTLLSSIRMSVKVATEVALKPENQLDYLASKNPLLKTGC